LLRASKAEPIISTAGRNRRARRAQFDGRLAKSFIVLIAVAAAAGPLTAREYRSREVTREFQREHPCPSTGWTTGACPGYRKDHIVPLACGGPDTDANLQWQTVAAAKTKDRWELRACGR